jgi:hypothetical protein
MYICFTAPPEYLEYYRFRIWIPDAESEAQRENRLEEGQAFFVLVGFGSKKKISEALILKSPPPLLKGQ